MKKHGEGLGLEYRANLRRRQTTTPGPPNRFTAPPAYLWEAVDDAKSRDVVCKNTVLNVNLILASDPDRLLLSGEFPECCKMFCSTFINGLYYQL